MERPSRFVISCLMIALLSTALYSHAKSPTVDSANKWAPAFLEVGKSYNMIYFGDVRFTVIQIGPSEGWVLVELKDGKKYVWLNVQNALLIQPL